MTTDAEKVLEAILTGWNQKDWEGLAAVHTDDWVDHTAPVGYKDISAMKNFFGQFTDSFPDMEMEIGHWFENGDELAYYYTIRGTQEKDFLNFSGRGNQVEFSGMLILKMKDGKCAEAWGVTDRMTLFDQLRIGAR